MQPGTLTELVRTALERHPRDDQFGFRRDGAWRTMSSAQALDRITRLAGALEGAGVGAGDRVAIVAPTSLDWTLADVAVGSLRAIVVPVYPTLAAPQMARILLHSGARLAFAGGPDEWAKLDAVRGELPALKETITFAPVAGPGAPRSLEAFLDGARAPQAAGPSPDDLASIIYTSGTTGEPKGVMLSHANIVHNVLACTEVCPFRRDDVHLSFLPLSHIFERMVNYYMVWNGLRVYFCEDIARVRECLAEVRPTVLTSVPRVFEKVLASIEEEGRRGGAVKERIVRMAIGAARAYGRTSAAGARVPLGLRLRHRVADRLVLSKVRAKLGGRVRVVITGGAATPLGVTEFFIGAGVQMLPGYGLTESSPVIAFNTPDDNRLGTVGRPIPGMEVAIAPDGEILARGPSVMRGYYANEQATGEALTPDGWLRTGDVGALDPDGFLRITDRKKDLIATAGGKKVAPQPIEEALARDPFIAQAVLLGEGRPYITALLVPQFGALEDWARRRGLATGDRAALLAHDQVRALYRERVEGLMRDLSRFEAVKRFHLLEDELSEARGELTPTLKVKRRVVEERYRTAIESLYA